MSTKGAGDFHEWRSAFEADLLTATAARPVDDVGGPLTLTEIIEFHHAHIRFLDEANRIARAELEAEVKATVSAMQAYVRLRRLLPSRSNEPVEVREDPARKIVRTIVVDDTESSSEAQDECEDRSWWGKQDFRHCKVCGEKTYVYKSSRLRSATFKRCQNAQCESHLGRRRRKHC